MKTTSLDKVINAIDSKQSFLLEAGAGSGKTYTLIQSLNHILDNHSEKLRSAGQKISCITFTNVAKDEIVKRIENSDLVVVQTIHEFLWDCVKNFQSSLHTKLGELNDEYERQRTEEGRRKGYEHIQDLDEKIAKLNVSYTDYGRNFQKGLLTHEDVITISYYMFRDYSSLSDILANKYPYIFIDEYQDTEEGTILSLLEHHLKQQQGNVVVGFFGDSMQKIYDQGIGKIDPKYYQKASKDKLLEYITKEENYRCSLVVIELLNKIRKNIKQVASGNNKKGAISFLYGQSDYDNYFEYLKKQGWDFDDLNTKVLFLTHTRIAKKLGYENLLGVYTKRYGQFGRDRLIKKEERFSKFFFHENGIEKVLSYYEQRKYGEVINMLRDNGYGLTFHKDKEKIDNTVKELISIREKGTIRDVLDFVKRTQILSVPDIILDFERYLEQETDTTDDEKIQKDTIFYNALMGIQYLEVISFYDFVENKTVFSTKHGTKGDEYENVLVIIDDGSWRQSYSFKEMFAGESKYPERLQRTLNLFYVCCSRAKNNLSVATVSTMDEAAMSTVKDWFGESNLVDIRD